MIDPSSLPQEAVKERLRLLARTVSMATQFAKAGSAYIDAVSVDAGAASGSPESLRLRRKRKALIHELAQWKKRHARFSGDERENS